MAKFESSLHILAFTVIIVIQSNLVVDGRHQQFRRGWGTHPDLDEGRKLSRTFANEHEPKYEHNPRHDNGIITNGHGWTGVIPRLDFMSITDSSVPSSSMSPAPSTTAAPTTTFTNKRTTTTTTTNRRTKTTRVTTTTKPPIRKDTHDLSKIPALNYFVQKQMLNSSELEKKFVIGLYNRASEHQHDEVKGPSMFKKFVDFHYALKTYSGQLRLKTFGESCVVDVNKAFGLTKSSRLWPQELGARTEMLAVGQLSLIQRAVANATKLQSQSRRGFGSDPGDKIIGDDWNEERFRVDPEDEVWMRKTVDGEEEKEGDEGIVQKAILDIVHQDLDGWFVGDLSQRVTEQRKMKKVLEDTCDHKEYLVCLPTSTTDTDEGSRADDVQGRCACRTGFVQENHQCYVPLLGDCNRNNLFLSHDLKLLTRGLLDQIKTPPCIGDAECLNDFVCSSSVINSTGILYSVFLFLLLHAYSSIL